MKNKSDHIESGKQTRFADAEKYRKHFLVGTLCAVILAAGLVVYFQKDNSSETGSTQATSEPIRPVKFQAPTNEYESAIYKADQLLIKSDYDGSIKLLEAALIKTTDKAQQYTLQSKIGYSYKAKGDWKNAIKWFEQAQATGQPAASGLYLEIAEAAEKADDKPKAIAAYKKVLEQLVNNPSPAAKKIAESYRAKIKSLGGQ